MTMSSEIGAQIIYPVRKRPCAAHVGGQDQTSGKAHGAKSPVIFSMHSTWTSITTTMTRLYKIGGARSIAGSGSDKSMKDGNSVLILQIAWVQVILLPKIWQGALPIDPSNIASQLAHHRLLKRRLRRKRPGAHSRRPWKLLLAPKPHLPTAVASESRARQVHHQESQPLNQNAD